MPPNEIKRGDIWTADLRPGKGQEVAKKRPALVISNNTLNTISPTVIIIPISSQKYSVLGPERIFLSAKDSSLPKDSVILSYQIRAVDKARLLKRVSSLKETILQEVEDALKIVLDLDQEFHENN